MVTKTPLETMGQLLPPLLQETDAEREETTLLSLSPDMLAYINSFLNAQDSGHFMMALHALYKPERFKRAFQGKESEAVTQFFYHTILKHRPLQHRLMSELYPKLNRIDLTGQNLTPTEFRDLLSCMPHVVEVHLSDCQVTAAHLTVLAPLPHLRALSLVNCRLTDHLVGKLGELKALRTLDLSKNKQVTGATFERLTQLEELKCMLCGLTNQGAGKLQHASHLRVLDMRGNRQLDGSFFPLLPRSLQALSLSGCQINPAFREQLSQETSLKI